MIGARVCFLSLAVLWGCADVFAESSPLAVNVSQKFRGYLQPINTYTNYDERLDLGLKKSFETEGGSKLVLAPLFSFNMPNSVGGDRKNESVVADVSEAWAGTGGTLLDFSAGYEQISWGAADIANPTDVWNPRDYTDLLSPKKLSQLTIQALIHPVGFRNIDVQLLYSPIFRDPRLPIVLPSSTSNLRPSDSRWLLLLPTHIMLGSNSLPLHYEIQSPTYDNVGDYGIRIRAPHVFDWDFAFYAFNGLEKLPRFAFEERGSAATPELPITITLKPSFHRQDMLGFDVSGIFGDSEIGMRLEAAYVRRENAKAVTPSLVRNDYIQSVISLDKSFSDDEFSYLDYVNLSYVHFDETTNRSQPQNTSYLPRIELSQSQNQPWKRSLALLIKEEVFEDWTLKSVVIYETSNASYYLSPSIETEWTESLTTEIGVDLLDGPKNSFFGQYKDNQRVFFNMTYLM